MARKETILAVNRKRGAIIGHIDGRASASSSSLSASYGLPLDQVQAILRSKGVRDDG